MKRSELINHTFLIIFSIFLLFTAAANSFAVGKATSMGDMQTVVPSGPFDVARNPALLPLQEKANSTGLFYTNISHYPGYASRNENTNKESGPPSATFDIYTNSDSKQDDPDIKGMSGHIANSTKSGSTAFGFAITDNGKDQYSVTKRKSTVESVGYYPNPPPLPPPTLMLFSKREEAIETREINPAFISAIGKNINNSSFIGFQLIFGYSNRVEKKKSHIINYLGPYPMGVGGEEFYEDSEKEVKRISAELGFGYLYRDNNQQLGLLIRAGEVAWTEKSLKITRNNITPLPGTLEANSSVKTNAKYMNGPSITAGAYKKINPYFGMAFESGIKLETSVVDKDLVYKQDVSAVEEEKSVNRNKNTYLFKAGIELNLAKSLTFTTGLGYVQGAFETNRYLRKGTLEHSVTGTFETKRAFFTLGLQYMMSNNMTIDLLAACTAYRDSAGIRITDRDPTPNVSTEVRANQKEEGIFGYAGVGVTLSL